MSSELRSEIEARLKAEHQTSLHRAVEQAHAQAAESLTVELGDLKARIADKDRKAKEAEEAQIALLRQTRELQERNETLAEKVRAEVEAKLRAEVEERVRIAVAEGEARAREGSVQEMKLLHERLAEQQRKVQIAHEAELALRKDKAALEERQLEMDLEVARKIDAEKQRLEEGIRKAVSEEQSLRVKEKDKQIEDLKTLIDQMKRKSEQGSQELQGEVLELGVEAALARQFPFDRVAPVAKGTAGADLVQTVCNNAGQPCGTIVWEAKWTKNWSPAWIAKLKHDQRAIGANLAVLVSVALPEGFGEFGSVDGVWVSSLRAWPALAVALREQILQVAFARAASEGRHEKTEMLYRYLTGDPFRHKIQGIVEAFTALQDQLNRERRAMEKQWKEREKQIERVVLNTVGMYGEMRGIVGTSLPQIPALELEEHQALDGPDGLQ